MAGMMTGMMMKLSAVTMVSRSQRTHCRPYPEETPTLGSADQGLFARAWTGGIWVLNIDDDLTLSLKKERVRFHSQSRDFDASFRLHRREWTVSQMLNVWDTLSFVSPPPFPKINDSTPNSPPPANKKNQPSSQIITWKWLRTSHEDLHVLSKITSTFASTLLIMT